MKRGLSKRLLAVLLVLSMVLAYALPTYAADGQSKLKFEQVSNSLLPSPIKDAAVHNTDAKQYKDTDVVRVSIFLNGKSTLDAGYSTQSIANNAAAMRYQQKLAITQTAVEERINRRLGEKLDVVWNLTLVANAISANVEYGKIETIKKVPGVSDVVLECSYEAAKDTGSDTAKPNAIISTGMTGASAAWQSGYTGVGSKIAIIDTGLDVAHQSVDAGAFLHAIEGKDVDLMDESDIANVFSNLNIAKEAGEAKNLYVNAKVPFAFNYVDLNDDISHVNDTQGEHGSHVAGIAAANRYIPDGNGGYKDALESVYAAGTAPDAQLLVMKVFGKGGGAKDSDYMAAIEDAILLGCDSVNLSLGSSVAGMTTDKKYQAILDKLAESDTVVTTSGGNNSYWAEYTDVTLLHSDDVNWATGGSPGSFTNSFTVASVNNNGMVAPTFSVGGHKFSYLESAQYGNPPFERLTQVDTDTEYDFVYLDSPGYVSAKDENGQPLVDADGNTVMIDQFAKLGDLLKGKIAMCNRGESSFLDKANLAAAAGAAGVIIVNNQPGVIYLNIDGYTGNVPVTAIYQTDGAYFKEAGTKAEADGFTYYAGKMTVNYTAPLKIESSYYTMSDFSSWGVPSDLSLKPEITAPGGNIWSINGTHKENGELLGGTDAYELMSGTSMAAPQVAGLAAVVQQYIRDNKLSQDGLTDRALTQSLLMSTAVPMKDADGNYYPVFQQGSGLANVANATTASSYVLMCQNATDAYADGKVKAELGANTEGSYDFSFILNNLTDTELEYKLSADVFTQAFTADEDKNFYSYTSTLLLGDTLVTFSVGGKELIAGGLTGYDFDNDGDTDLADAQLLMDHVVKGAELLNDKDKADVDTDGDVDTYDVYTLMSMIQEGIVTVPASGSVQVDVHMELSADTKGALDELAPNGAYVEAYVFAKSVATAEGVEGVTHSIPVLGYYGNWADPSMFDRLTALDLNFNEEDMDFHPLQNAYDIPYLCFGYAEDGSDGHWGGTNAFTDPDNNILGDNPVTYDDKYLVDRAAINSNTPIGKVFFTLIRNAGASRITVKADGQLVYEKNLGEQYAPFFDDSSMTWVDVVQSLSLNLNLQGLPEDTELETTFTAVPEYFIKDGKVDWEAGKGTTLTSILHIDDTAPTISGVIKQADGSITVAAKDNRYIAAILVYPNNGEGTDPAIVYAPNMEHKGDLVADIPMVDDMSGEALTDDVYLIQVVDYAGNISTYRLFYGMEETTTVEGVAIDPAKVNLVVGGSGRISAAARPVNLSDRSVTWTTSDPAIATVNESGVVTGVAVGTCTVTATSKLDPTKSASCLVTVTKIEENLNGLVWDTEGKIWWSEFNTAELPNYTKLSDKSVTDQKLASVTYGPGDKLYALSLDADGSSSLYSVDETTLEPTRIGACGAWFADIAYLPSLDLLFGVQGPVFAAIDATTGQVMTDLVLGFDDSLTFVGIAHSGMFWSADHTQIIDELYLVDSNGDLYAVQFTFSATTGQLEGIPCGQVAHIGDPVDVNLYNSLYCTDNYLYWSRFKKADDRVELIAMDLYTGDSYSLGHFADSVWPVGGLFQLNASAQAAEGASISRNVEDLTADELAMFSKAELETTYVEAPVATGSLQSVAPAPVETVRPQSNGSIQKPADSSNNNYVVQVTAQDLTGAAAASNNGRYAVTWDPNAMELVSDLVSGQVHASVTGNGSYEFGYADLDAFAPDAVVATLVFKVKDNKTIGVDVTHKEEGNQHSENAKVDVDHEHQFTDTVTAPTCTAEGYTTHTCSECGYSYTDTKVPATGHELGEWKSDENGHYHECAKCGLKVDGAGHDYKWVVDKEATATEKGSKHQECSVCGHKTAAVDIPAKGSSAQTGDDSNIWLWVGLLAVSATGLAVLVLFSRKRKIAE